MTTAGARPAHLVRAQPNNTLCYTVCNTRLHVFSKTHCITHIQWVCYRMCVICIFESSIISRDHTRLRARSQRDYGLRDCSTYAHARDAYAAPDTSAADARRTQRTARDTAYERRQERVQTHCGSRGDTGGDTAWRAQGLRARRRRAECDDDGRSAMTRRRAPKSARPTSAAPVNGEHGSSRW